MDSIKLERNFITESRPLRLGIIGAGAIVRAQHLPAIMEARGFEVAGIADLSQGNAESCFSKIRELDSRDDAMVGRHYSSHAEMLAGCRLDAVLIATPNNTHLVIAQDCLKVGVHVLCEKPVAFTPQDHDLLHKLAEDRGLVFQVGLVFRYSPVFRSARRLLTEEVSGPPLMLLINEFRPFAFQPWRTSAEISGGMFMEKNCHHFDLFNWMLGDADRATRVVAFGGQHVLKGEPKRVWALREEVELPASEVIDHAFVLVEYASGAKAQLGISFFTPWGREFRMGIMGENWKIDIYEMERLIYLHQNAKSKHQRFPPDPEGRRWQGDDFEEEGFVHTGAVDQWREFHRCIVLGEEPSSNLARARESIRIAQAAQRSVDQHGATIQVK